MIVKDSTKNLNCFKSTWKYFADKGIYLRTVAVGYDVLSVRYKKHRYDEYRQSFPSYVGYAVLILVYRNYRAFAFDSYVRYNFRSY